MNDGIRNYYYIGKETSGNKLIRVLDKTLTKLSKNKLYSPDDGDDNQDYIRVYVVNGAYEGWINYPQLDTFVLSQRSGGYEYFTLGSMLWSGDEVQGCDYNDQMEWCDEQIKRLNVVAQGVQYVAAQSICPHNAPEGTVYFNTTNETTYMMYNGEWTALSAPCTLSVVNNSIVRENINKVKPSAFDATGDE